MKEIEKTKNAIEIEEDKIYEQEKANLLIPKVFFELVDRNLITQWRRHPFNFFVNGIKEARIKYDKEKKEVLSCNFRRLTTAEDREKFLLVLKKLREKMPVEEKSKVIVKF